MKTTAKAVIVGLVAAGGLALTASSASAYIACNGAGECWHVHHRAYYNYDPAWGVVVHPDNWRWGPGDHYVWREHHGRGYWRNGVWIRF